MSHIDRSNTESSYSLDPLKQDSYFVRQSDFSDNFAAVRLVLVGLIVKFNKRF